MASVQREMEWSRDSRYVCSICLDPFLFPKLLPCAHTFCHKCLVSVMDHSERNSLGDFTCPTCRAPAPNIRLPDDISKLPSNFYITHADIERSLLVVNKNCSRHSESSLKYLCLDCDTFVCENCKLADHLDHKTKDLTVTGQKENGVWKGTGASGSTEGGVGVGRFAELMAKKEVAKETVMKKLKATIAACRKEQRTLKDKRDIIERQVRSHVKLVVEVATKASAVAMTKLIRLNRSEQYKLQASIDRMEQHLADLKKKGEGLSAKDLLVAHRVARTRVPTVKHLTLKTKRRRLANFRSVAGFVGYPAILAENGKKTTGNTPRSVPPVDRLAPIMTVKKLFKVGEEDQGRGVQNTAMIRALCPVDKDDVVWVLYDMSSPLGNRVTYEACYTHKGKLVFHERSKQDHALGIDQGQLYRAYTRYGTIYLTRSYSLFSLAVNRSRQDCVVWKKGPKPGIRFERGMTFVNRCPESFAASPDGEVFALVDKLSPSDKVSGLIKSSPTHLKDVMLFHSGSNHPFAVYLPPEGKIYSPTDVCFFPIRGTCMLLVADWMSDLVHVVHVGETEVTFVRYLDTGRNDIVKPVTLIPDSRGRLLIGCGDGQVLLCSPN